MTKVITSIKIKLVNRFPFLARYSRWAKAVRSHYSRPKTSYSQHGEDAFIWNVLNKHFPGRKYYFIDIGGFHPMELSNSYLLYRNKNTGVVVEPNTEMVHLHRRFRPADIQLPIACGKENSIRPFFFLSTFPALSSLNNREGQGRIQRRYLPLLSLDTIYKGLAQPKIFFLSIDVEGHDLAVLQGGEQTLKHTFLVCVECNVPDEKAAISAFLEKRDFFLLRQFACNLIFQNKYFEPGPDQQV